MKKFIAVIGSGKTGLSCARYLNKFGKNFIVFDDRSNPPNQSEIKHLSGQNVHLVFDIDILSQAEYIIMSPGVSPNQYAFNKLNNLFSDIEIFACMAKAPIIAITGTNGKSTVTTLTAKMFEASGKKVLIGGNIGVPVLDLLTEEVPDFYILELSSFQLQLTYSLSAYASVVLNVSEDHLDWHGDLESYRNSKLKVYDNAKYKVESIGQGYKISGSILSFDDMNLMLNNKNIFPINKMYQEGRHNILNSLASLGLGIAAGCKINKMLAVLESFAGLPHRCQKVLEQGGVAWFNDSKATNIGACLSSVQNISFGGPVILLLGGVGKGADFTQLSDGLLRFKDKINQIIVYGESAGALLDSLQQFHSHIDTSPGSYSVNLVQKVLRLADAVELASKIAVSGDQVLLAPACASFDEFKNFEERGEFFESVARSSICKDKRSA